MYFQSSTEVERRQKSSQNENKTLQSDTETPQFQTINKLYINYTLKLFVFLMLHDYPENKYFRDNSASAMVKLNTTSLSYTNTQRSITYHIWLFHLHVNTPNLNLCH